MSRKVIRDSIHDLIHIDHQVHLKIVDSVPLQRLRYIRQLGFAWLVYPCAEHSRFTHSLGVYHVAQLLLKTLKIDDEYKRHTLLCAALLHDVGHGPFSHLFERVLREVNYGHYKDHADWSREIIQQHPQLANAMDGIDVKLKEKVADVLQAGDSSEELASIVSSQFDADRLDYMLRDCHSTGVHYGQFDLNWLLHCLSIRNVLLPSEEQGTPSRTIKVLAVDGSRGVSALEHYILGLFHLYQNVYHHKTVLAAESMLVLALRRAVDCIRAKIGSDWPAQLIKIALNERLTLSEYMSLDDFTVTDWLRGWSSYSRDHILADLSLRLLDRRLFKTVRHHMSIDQLAKVKEELKMELQKRGLDPNYYLYEAQPKRIAYKTGESLAEDIFVIDVKDEVKRFSRYAQDEKLKISSQFSELKLDEHYLVIHPDFKQFALEAMRL